MKTTILYMFLYHLTSFSSVDDCFTMVDSCPETREKWIERSNEYNCTSGRFYTCLMNDSNRSLAEACIYSPKVPPSKTGCPVFALCGKGYGPMIADKFKPCAEEVIGCPTSNHSGYYLTEMYKYPECLKNSFVEKINKTGVQLISTTPSTTGQPNTDSRDNGHLILKIIVPLVSMLSIVIAWVVIFWKRKRLGNCKRWKFPPKKKDEALFKRHRYHKVQQSETKTKTIEEDETNNEDKIGSFKQIKTDIKVEDTTNKVVIGESDPDVKVEVENLNDDEEESKPEQKNQNEEILEAEMDTVTKIPAEEPTKKLDIPVHTMGTALDEHHDDDSNTRPQLTIQMPSIKEESMQSPIEPSTVACTAKGKMELAIDVYKPLPCNLEELQREEYLSGQMPSPFTRENRISRRPASPTDSFQSKPEQKNQNKEILEAEMDTVTKIPAEEPTKKLDIPVHTMRTALDEHHGDDFNTRTKLTIQMPSITEEGMQSPIEPSTVACTAKGKMELAIDVYKPLPCNLEELQREECVSSQMPSPFTQENRISRRPASPTDSFQSISIPSEIMQYFEDIDFKQIVPSLNVTTMKLLTKAPQAIRNVGRLHFVAILTIFQIGPDSLEGEELRTHASEFGEESNKCFETAKNNITNLRFILKNVIDRLKALSSMMPDEHQEHKPGVLFEFIHSTSESIDECAELCLKTQETFIDLRKRLVPFDKSFQRAKKKVDEMDYVGTKGGLDLSLSRVSSSLNYIRELIEQTEDIFTELCNRWKIVTDFFQEMHSFFTRQMKSDITLYSRLSAARMTSHNEGRSVMKFDRGEPRPIENVLRELQLKARYGQIISEFYLYVSREFLADCLHQLSRSLYLDDQRDDAGRESTMDKLEKRCIDAEHEIIYLCDKIEQLIKR